MSVGAFSLDQLMELAGLSVSQAGSQPVRSLTKSNDIESKVKYFVYTRQVKERKSWSPAVPATMVILPSRTSTFVLKLTSQRRRRPSSSSPSLPLRLPTDHLLPQENLQRALRPPRHSTQKPRCSLHRGLQVFIERYSSCHRCNIRI